MNIFKSSITVLACAGFLVFAFMLGGDIHSERVKSDMVKYSILKYSPGASTYLAERDNHSKILFGNLSGYDIFGIGALTESDDKQKLLSGLSLYSPNNELNLPKINDILTASVSPKGSYMSVIDIKGQLTVVDVKSGRITFSTADNETVFTSNPLNADTDVKPPFSCWLDGKYIFTMIANEDIVWGVPTESNYSLVSINPNNGEKEIICEKPFENDIMTVLGKISKTHLLVLAIPSDLKSVKSPRLCSVDIAHNTVEYQEKHNDSDSLIGYIQKYSLIYILKDKKIVSKRISKDSFKTPSAVELPTISDTQLIVSDLSGLRMTSRGYLYAKHFSSGKYVMIDLRSSNLVFLDADEVPY